MSEEEKKPDHVARVWRLVEAIVPWGAFALAVAGVGLFIVLTGWVLVDFFNVLDNPPLKDGINDRAAVRNVGLVLAALVAGAFAVWRAEIARRATAAAEAQVKRQQDRDYADLFTKAVEQLGTTREIRSKDKDGNDIYTYKPNIEVRLGAIYALERISQDSERDHIAVMETLCAYVRENAPAAGCEALPVTLLSGHKNDPLRWTMDWGKARGWWQRIFDESLRAWIWTLEVPRADVQAVLTVLGRRSKERVRYEVGDNPKEPRYALDLRKANLRKADMRAGDFRNALFSEAHLQGAYLRWADLQGADLIEAHLEGAYLSEAHFEEANLRWAHLEGANLIQAHMEGSSLIEAHFEGANLSLTHLEGAYLTEAHLEGANLSEAHLEGANLGWARFEGAYLSVAHMEGAYLHEAHLEGADLSVAHLEGADLSWTHLEGANLIQAHLEGAYLIRAQLKSAKLAIVRIDSVMASFADFTDAEGLSQEAVESCFGCAGTVLPEGLDRPAHWHPERLESWHERNEAHSVWQAARAAEEKPDWVDAADWSGWDGAA